MPRDRHRENVIDTLTKLTCEEQPGYIKFSDSIPVTIKLVWSAPVFVAATHGRLFEVGQEDVFGVHSELIGIGFCSVNETRIRVVESTQPRLIYHQDISYAHQEPN